MNQHTKVVKRSFAKADTIDPIYFEGFERNVIFVENNQREHLTWEVSHAWLIAGVCATLLVFHLLLRLFGKTLGQGLDPIALGLTLVGLSPWIARVLDSTKIGGVEVKFREIDKEVRDQRNDLEAQKFIISHFLGRDELLHLEKLAKRDEFEIDVTHFPEEFKAELRHLRALGFVENFEGRGIRSLYEHDPRTVKRDMHKFFQITPSGKRFLQLRTETASTAAQGV